MPEEIEKKDSSLRGPDESQGGWRGGRRPVAPEEEKLELLKRKEIRTMQKDISRLRETEAQKERDRIAALKTTEEIEKRKEKLEKLRKGEETRKRKIERLRLEKELKELLEEKGTLEIKKNELAKNNSQLEEILRIILAREIEIEKKERVIEEKEKVSRLPQEKHEIEKERWSIEEERRKIESERWRREEELKKNKVQFKEADLKYQQILKKEEEIKSSLRRLEEVKEIKPEKLREEGELKEKEVKKVPPEALIPKPLPKKPSPFKKVLVRGVIVIVLLLISSFFYWFFEVKKPAEEEAILPTGEEIIPLEEIIEEPEAVKPEISAPSIAERILGRGYRIPSSPRLIDAIILHSSYNALGGDLHDIEKVIEEYKMYEVAPHYLLARNGTIYRLVLDKNIAYHAGKSEMPDGRISVNNFSIGIEVIYAETESPTETQYQTLARLVKYLQQEYNIPLKNILGHEDVDIAPPFKSDPWNFDWEYFESLLE